jgi:hypothetical protein
MRRGNINEGRLATMVDEEVDRQLNEIAWPLLGLLYNVGAKGYDYFKNRGRASNPSDPRWIHNTSNELIKTIESCIREGYVDYNIGYSVMNDAYEIRNILERAGIKDYDPKALNLDWSILDPTGGLATGAYIAASRALKGGSLL